jgi:hypothetical protein
VASEFKIGEGVWDDVLIKGLGDCLCVELKGEDGSLFGGLVVASRRKSLNGLKLRNSMSLSISLFCTTRAASSGVKIGAKLLWNGLISSELV